LIHSSGDILSIHTDKFVRFFLSETKIDKNRHQAVAAEGAVEAGLLGLLVGAPEELAAAEADDAAVVADVLLESIL
jgi:hypothetical protein